MNNPLTTLSTNDRLERIEHQLTRIADALDRAIPPVKASVSTPGESPAELITVGLTEQLQWETESEQQKNGELASSGEPD